MSVLQETIVDRVANCPICKRKTVVVDYYVVDQGSFTVRCYCYSCSEDFDRQFLTFDETFEVLKLLGEDKYYQGPTRVAEDDFLSDLIKLREMDRTSVPVTTDDFKK